MEANYFSKIKILKNTVSLSIIEIALSSSSTQLIDIPHSLIRCPHIIQEKSVHLYVISSRLPVSKAEQSRHRTLLIQEIIVYPEAKYHFELYNNTTLVHHYKLNTLDYFLFHPQELAQ